MRFLSKSIVMLLLWCCGVSLYAKTSEDVAAIMAKVDQRQRPNTMISTIQLTLLDKRKHQRVRMLRRYEKTVGKDTQTIMFFLSPSDVKHTAFLSVDYDDPTQETAQWLYLPAINKTKRIASNKKKEAFMGSDFSYADMEWFKVSDYTFTLMDTEMIRKHLVWKIRALPKSTFVTDKTGYSEVMLYVRQDNYVITRAVYHLMDKHKKKYFDLKKLEYLKGVWVPTHMVMFTREHGRTVHATVIQQTSTKLNMALPNTLFQTQQLEKGPLR